MHELSLAQSIVEIVQQHLPPGATQVETVRVRVGEMAGVVAGSLEFCFTALAQQTSLQGARLLIDAVPLTCACSDCRKDFHPANFDFHCPACGGHQVEILSGRELQVVEIELHEEAVEIQ